jgi:hypothetical protein
MSPITPDTKDWTWVLTRTCSECGFDVTVFPREEIGAMIRENGGEWRDVLGHPKVRERPSENKWSALEYSCHVRDVFRLYDERLEMMLTQDNPTYPNWDQDETAVAQRYGEQDPLVVRSELMAAAGELADRFDRMRGDEWGRTGTRSDGASFTIESFARYLIHDPVHHLHDVRTGFEELTQ